MRQYTVTELSEKDIETIETALREKKLQASIDHLFWIPVPDDLLTPLQKEHATTCGPHVMALEVMRSSLTRNFWYAPGTKSAATASPMRTTG